MKKSIRQAIILAMVMILAVTSTALADTIVSSSFKFNSVMEQPEATPAVEPEAEPTEEPAAEPTEEVVEESVVPEEPAVEPTEEVVEESAVTEEPAVEPTEEVVEEPAVTEEPAVEPTEEVVEEPAATEEPTAEPTAEPTVEPEVTLTVTSNLAGRKAVLIGTEMVLTLTVDGAEEIDYSIQWQSSADGGVTWENVPGATEHQLKVILMQEHAGLLWRASINTPD